MQLRTDAPRRKPYAKLRGLLKEYDYTQADIARKLGCSRYYLGDLMNDNRPWPLPYCYAILDMFRIDHSELTTYFPPEVTQHDNGNHTTGYKSATTRRNGGSQCV